MSVQRRTLLLAGAGAGLAGMIPVAGSSARAVGSPTADPFTLGVASGDPWPDSVVLWTRLAVDPTADNGLGGLSADSIAVRWEIATDEAMTRIVRRGAQPARSRFGYAVHAIARGLQPGREYFYRFRTDRHVSPVGRTRTLPRPTETPASLAMAFTSCARYEQGYFGAYRDLAAGDPDVVLGLGDYIYEYAAGANQVRLVEGPETSTLAHYRQRYAQYHADPDLQAAHAVAPWLVTWDDHEVDNNWAGDVPEDRDAAEGNATTETFRARRQAAFQAFAENLPVRWAGRRITADQKIFQRVAWGSLATFHMLDTRQYRDDQVCGDGGFAKNCPGAVDPTRTMLGSEQERWLLDGFGASRARWDVLGQQVFFSARDRDPSREGTDVSMDAWDGYAPARQRVTQGWIDAGVRNAVVLTGDVHRAWAAEVKTDYADPDSPAVGTELVCTSVSSGGDGTDANSDPVLQPVNPHLKFFSDRRGYTRTVITADEMTAEYRAVTAVSDPASPVTTAGRFRIADGRPGPVPA